MKKEINTANSVDISSENNAALISVIIWHLNRSPLQANESDFGPNRLRIEAELNNENGSTAAQISME